MESKKYLWFGGKAGEPLPDMSEFKTAKHTKGDSEGDKQERPNIRVVTKKNFERFDDMEDIIDLLLGPSEN